MVKVNELRVGNIVDYFSENADRWINSKVLYENDLSCLLSDKGDHAEPIPLTEEWLIKFGFKSYNDRGDYYIELANQNPFHLYISERQSLIHLVNVDQPGAHEVYPSFDWVKHIHQLQNLYFALTGEELTIKE